MTCRDVMTPIPVYCVPEDTVQTAAGYMKKEDVGAVPTVNSREDRRLVGMVTDRDLALKVIAPGLDCDSTQVKQVMSTGIVSCRLDDDYQKAVGLMSRHQVRRVPIIDEQGRLVGMISQADVAISSDDQTAGRVVEDISKPRRGFMPHIPRPMHHARTESDGTSVGSSLVGALAAMGIGAASMYLLDPNRGRARRSYVRDKALRAYHQSAAVTGRVARDVQHRAEGVVASTKRRLSSEEPVSDGQLEARVRSKLGRVSSHPKAIHVSAQHGRVTLEGPILADEVNDVVSAVERVPGVCDVDNRLQVHSEPDNIPELQGEGRRIQEGGLMNTDEWSIGTRALATALGGGLAFYGARTSGLLAKTAAGIGFAILARSVAPNLGRHETSE